MVIKKYRPYLTLDWLKELAEMSRSHNQLCERTKYLDHFIREIDSGYMKAQITVRPNVAQKLGFEEIKDSADDIEQSRRFNAGEMSDEESRAWMIKNNTDPDTWMPIDPTKKGL